MDRGAGQIQRRNATFRMTHQCTSETGNNVTAIIESTGRDILEVARVTPVVPSFVVRALEVAAGPVGSRVTRTASTIAALITAIGSYATMSGHYEAASLRETLLGHVESLLVAIERMDEAAAAAQWNTLKGNFTTFKQASRAEFRFCLDEVALPLYHVASMALQTKAFGFDFSDDNLVRVKAGVHTFIVPRWPRTAGQLRIEEVL